MRASSEQRASHGHHPARLLLDRLPFAHERGRPEAPQPRAPRPRHELRQGEVPVGAEQAVQVRRQQLRRDGVDGVRPGPAGELREDGREVGLGTACCLVVFMRAPLVSCPRAGLFAGVCDGRVVCLAGREGVYVFLQIKAPYVPHRSSQSPCQGTRPGPQPARTQTSGPCAPRAS